MYAYIIHYQEYNTNIYPFFMLKKPCYSVSNTSPVVNTSPSIGIPSSPFQGHKADPKGKAVCESFTPYNSPGFSDINTFDFDIGQLLNQASLNMKPLTIHKHDCSPSPVISSNSTGNITVRRREKRGSRHFHGRNGRKDMTSRDIKLIDIPISEITFDDFTTRGPLRAIRPSDVRNE